MDFIVYDESIFYVTGYISTRDDNINSTDDMLSSIEKSEINVTSNLIEMKSEKGQEKIIASNSSGFQMVPTSNGIVYYDINKKQIVLRTDEETKLLKEEPVLCLFSDNKYVYYTSLKRLGIYRISLESMAEEKVYDEFELFTGICDNKAYLSDGMWVSLNLNTNENNTISSNKHS